MFNVLIAVIVLVLSYGLAFMLTMFFFWIDLEINNPDAQDQIDKIRGRHLKMHKYLHLSLFVGICIYIFVG